MALTPKQVAMLKSVSTGSVTAIFPSQYATARRLWKDGLMVWGIAAPGCPCDQSGKVVVLTDAGRAALQLI